MIEIAKLQKEIIPPQFIFFPPTLWRRPNFVRVEPRRLLLFSPAHFEEAAAAAAAASTPVTTVPFGDMVMTTVVKPRMDQRGASVPG